MENERIQTAMAELCVRLREHFESAGHPVCPDPECGELFDEHTSDCAYVRYAQAQDAAAAQTQNERIQISPLARAYLAAVRAGQVTEASPERQLMDAAHYILRYGVDGCTADVLRVIAALCEAVAELKEESNPRSGLN